MLSFATVLACSLQWETDTFSVEHPVERLGLAPGFCTGWAATAPVARRLQFGSGNSSLTPEHPLKELNKLFIQRTNHTVSPASILPVSMQARHSGAGAGPPQ